MLCSGGSWVCDRGSHRDLFIIHIINRNAHPCFSQAECCCKHSGHTRLNLPGLKISQGKAQHRNLFISWLCAVSTRLRCWWSSQSQVTNGKCHIPLLFLKEQKWSLFVMEVGIRGINPIICCLVRGLWVCVLGRIKEAPACSCQKWKFRCSA